MAELADALDLGSSGVTRGGSSPPSRIIITTRREREMNWFKRNDIDYADILIGGLAFTLGIPMVMLALYGAYHTVIETSISFIASAL